MVPYVSVSVSVSVCLFVCLSVCLFVCVSVCLCVCVHHGKTCIFENDILPLFGRRRYPNDSKYDYYTTIGQFGTKVPIVTKNRNDELGTNDVVFIKGSSSPYRVTIYESDFTQYIPYV